MGGSPSPADAPGEWSLTGCMQCWILLRVKVLLPCQETWLTPFLETKKKELGVGCEPPLTLVF